MVVLYNFLILFYLTIFLAISVDATELSQQLTTLTDRHTKLTNQVEIMQSKNNKLRTVLEKKQEEEEQLQQYVQILLTEQQKLEKSLNKSSACLKAQNAKNAEGLQDLKNVHDTLLPLQQKQEALQNEVKELSDNCKKLTAQQTELSVTFQSQIKSYEEKYSKIKSKNKEIFKFMPAHKIDNTVFSQFDYPETLKNESIVDCWLRCVPVNEQIYYVENHSSGKSVVNIKPTFVDMTKVSIRLELCSIPLYLQPYLLTMSDQSVKLINRWLPLGGGAHSLNTESAIKYLGSGQSNNEQYDALPNMLDVKHYYLVFHLSSLPDKPAVLFTAMIPQLKN